MATKILFDLQRVLSKPDFETVKEFMSLYNNCSPEDRDRTKVCFGLFVENCEKRYKRKFVDCHKVLSVRLEDVEQELATAENRGLRSPASEIRRNTGKHYRSCGDNDNRDMCDDYEAERHDDELAKAAKILDDYQRTIAIQKEHERHAQYSAGKNTDSPVKVVEDA